MAIQEQMFDFMIDFSEACKRVTSLDELSEVLKTSFQRFSVEMFSYVHCPPLGAVDYGPSEVVTHFGYPRRWTYFYLKNECCNFDPFIGHAFEKNEAFKWNEVIEKPVEDNKTKAFIEEVKALDVKEGYAFPVFGARFRSGFFTFAFDEKAAKLNELSLFMLQWACQTAHHRFVALKTQLDQVRGYLTAREKEILRWVSLGKSNAEISDILKISRHTIDGYLRNIYIKLDVSERVSASHRALALGFI